MARFEGKVAVVTGAGQGVDMPVQRSLQKKVLQ